MAVGPPEDEAAAFRGRLPAFDPTDWQICVAEAFGIPPSLLSMERNHSVAEYPSLSPLVKPATESEPAPARTTEVVRVSPTVEVYDGTITIDLNLRQALALYWSIDTERARENGHARGEGHPYHVPPATAQDYATVIEAALSAALTEAGVLGDAYTR